MEKSYIKKGDYFYIKLSDGRLWCPSLQCRGTKYKYVEPSLKSLNDYNVRTLDFTAIDFETATIKNRYPCQIGIVVVREGKIEECISRFIQPPENYYDKRCISVHHINPQITKDEPEFPDVWNDIKQYFENTVIVAHNAQFDIPVLENILSYYNIEYPSIRCYTCTCQIFNRLTLDKACSLYGIELSNHHDGLCDAKACAQLYLNWVNNVEPTSEVPVKSPSNMLFDDESMKGHSPLRGDILVKDLSNANPDNPFYDRKVVITGIFKYERKELAQMLKKMGADINTSISKKTNFVLIGEDPGLSKLEKIDQLLHDGFPIRKLYQEDLDAILSGEWDKYRENKEIVKDLDFTIDHYNKHHIKFKNDVNVIASKELFYGKGFAGKFSLFNQMTGNLGAAGDDLSIYPDTNICVLSNQTISKLENGIKDETILYIQDFYNNNKSVKFDFKFTSEQEILDFCKSRCEKCGDKCTMDLYNAYLNSIQND